MCAIVCVGASSLFKERYSSIDTEGSCRNDHCEVSINLRDESELRWIINGTL